MSPANDCQFWSGISVSESLLRATLNAPANYPVGLTPEDLSELERALKILQQVLRR